ncbi:MAG: ABC transporter substrate-binding protein [Synergistaceae bacterium]|nr:ABC transporter substrate-binding protein [Synergistaceae bacterium]
MKKLFLALALLVFVAGTAFAADTIKIGEIATVTGEMAAYGVAEVEAIKIAVEEINAAGGILGKKVEVVMYDCRTRQEDMVSAARRLVDQDKVCAVIGPSGSGLCIAAQPIFNAGKTPHIGTLPTNPLVTQDDKGKVIPYNFRVCFLDPYQGRMIAYFTAKELGLKKAAILYDVASDYSHGLREFFIESFKEYGGEIVADEGCRTDDIEFRSQLTNIKNTNADVVIFPFLGKPLPLAVKQAREIGITQTIVGGDGYGDFMWEITGDALANSYWINHVAPDDQTLIPFFKKYEEKTGTECKEFANAILAYDCVYWLKDAIERAGSDDPVKIRDALETTKDLKLVHAVLTMDAFHNPSDKDGVVLKCDPATQTALFFKKIKP